MYSVGDVARLAGLSVRMLRHYDEIGLLRPARVDPHTGYRWYEPAQLARLHRILALKDLGFSLAQVGRMVDDAVSGAELRGMLRLRQAELAGEITEAEERLRRVARRIHLIDLEGTMSDTNVTIKRVEQTKVAVLSAAVDGFGEPVGAALPPLYPRLFERLARAGVATRGNPIAFYETTDDEQIVAHAAVPVAPDTPTVEGVELRVLPAMEQAATLVHRGPMDDVDASYNLLLQWIAEHGLHTEGHSREEYVHCPDDRREWITELQFPVRPE